jgi:hypothetical protein
VGSTPNTAKINRYNMLRDSLLPEIGGGPASVVTLGFSQTLSYAHQGTHGDPFVSSPFADAEQPWSRGWRAHVTTWHLEINRQEKTSDW